MYSLVILVCFIFSGCFGVDLKEPVEHSPLITSFARVCIEIPELVSHTSEYLMSGIELKHWTMVNRQFHDCVLNKMRNHKLIFEFVKDLMQTHDATFPDALKIDRNKLMLNRNMSHLQIAFNLAHGYPCPEFWIVIFQDPRKQLLFGIQKMIQTVELNAIPITAKNKEMTENERLVSNLAIDIKKRALFLIKHNTTADDSPKNINMLTGLVNQIIGLDFVLHHGIRFMLSHPTLRIAIEKSVELKYDARKVVMELNDTLYSDLIGKLLDTYEKLLK